MLLHTLKKSRLGFHSRLRFGIHLQPCPCFFQAGIKGDPLSLPRSTMHVQSVSHWAPANIGPYSQAVEVSRKKCMGGRSAKTSYEGVQAISAGSKARRQFSS